MDGRTLTVVRGRGQAGLPVLTPAALLAAQHGGAYVLDVRHHREFAAGHLPTSVNVGLDERFARTCGAVVPPGVDVVVLGAAESTERAACVLDAAGLGPVVGAGRPDPSWTVRSPRIAATPEGPVQFVDVREGACERAGVVRMPLGELLCRLGELHPEGPTVVLDDDGYRSSAAASLLRACGFAEVAEAVGAQADHVIGRPRLRLLASA